MNERVAIFQERLSTLRIRCIKIDKVRQPNFNEFLDQGSQPGEFPTRGDFEFRILFKM